MFDILLYLFYVLYFILYNCVSHFCLYSAVQLLTQSSLNMSWVLFQRDDWLFK